MPAASRALMGEMRDLLHLGCRDGQRQDASARTSKARRSSIPR